LVAGFIHARPHLLLQVPKETALQGRAWPSPRSWDNASRGLAAFGLDPVAGAEAVVGAVGDGPGMEFIAWVREMDLPDPETLLADPASFRLPTRGDMAYAILAAVVAAVQASPSQDRWTAAWKVLAKAVEAGAPDLAASAARGLATTRQQGWTVPVNEVRALLPVLKAAGVM
jgi:hypothetical protein